MPEDRQVPNDVESFATVSDQGDLEGAAVGLANMARDLLAQESVQATLDRIVAHAVELVDGCDHAGILLLHNQRDVETAAATSDVAPSRIAVRDTRSTPCRKSPATTC